MYGMHFEKELGGDKTIGDLTPSVGWADGDQIQIANVDPISGVIGFSIYTYFEEDPLFINYDDPAGWYDGSFNKVDKTLPLPAGIGFWIYTTIEQSVTMAGQVIADDAVSYTASADRFIMMANSYPAPLNPNTDFTVTSGAFSPGDQIQVANVNQVSGVIGFSIYTYFEEDPLFINYDDPAGWYDGSFNKVDTAVIPLCSGFWFNATKNVAFEIVSPL